MSSHDDTSSANVPFAISMRGYDREQVTHYFQQVDAEMRVIAADRDAAAAHARELADYLEDARDDIDSLRLEIDKLSVPPTTAEGMSDRISRMLRLASDEASEVRAQAESEAAEILSVAQQEADQIRRDAQDYADETQSTCSKERAELTERRAAMEAEHEKTMTAAKAEAGRIVSAAESEAEQMDAQAKANRDRIHEDFELAMATRRDEAIATVTELEAASKREASERLEAADIESERRRQHAHSVSSERLNRSHELAESIRSLRSRMLGQLAEIRQQLDDVPTLLAELENETDLLDVDGIDLINDGLSDEAKLGKSSTPTNGETRSARHQAPESDTDVDEPVSPTANEDLDVPRFDDDRETGPITDGTNDDDFSREDQPGWRLGRRPASAYRSRTS